METQLLTPEFKTGFVYQGPWGQYFLITRTGSENMVAIERLEINLTQIVSILQHQDDIIGQ